MKITVDDLPRWNILYDGLATSPGGLSPQEREAPLRRIEYNVRVSDLGGGVPVCGYSAAVLAARALVHTANWPTVGFALRVAHNPSVFRSTMGAEYVASDLVVHKFRNALWACGQADSFARTLARRVRPWTQVLVLAHCVGVLEEQG